MKLSEIAKFVIVIPKATGFFSFLRKMPPVTYKNHARKSWRGRAFIGSDLNMDPSGSLRISETSLRGMSAQYSMTFEDLVADDWELVK